MAMAGQLVFIFFSFNLMLTYGRSLQKISMDERIVSSKPPIKINTVSHAGNTYTGKTNYSDVLGMIALVDAFPLLDEPNANNSDPCFPPKWSWIECNSDPRPRVIALDLSNQALFGLLPDFSSMDALQRIDLSQNSLVGSIPTFLGTFSHLQELNLAFNLFSGQVPDSIACNKNLKLTLNGNSGLYTSNACSSKSNGLTNPTPSVPSTTTNNDDGYVYTYYYTTKKKSKVGLIVGVTVPLLVVFWIAVGIFAIYRHKAKAAAAAVAAASPPPGPNASPSDPKPNMPRALDERPIIQHN